MSPDPKEYLSKDRPTRPIVAGVPPEAPQECGVAVGVPDTPAGVAGAKPEVRKETEPEVERKRQRARSPWPSPSPVTMWVAG